MSCIKLPVVYDSCHSNELTIESIWISSIQVTCRLKVFQREFHILILLRHCPQGKVRQAQRMDTIQFLAPFVLCGIHGCHLHGACKMHTGKHGLPDTFHRLIDQRQPVAQLTDRALFQQFLYTRECLRERLHIYSLHRLGYFLCLFSLLHMISDGLRVILLGLWQIGNSQIIPCRPRAIAHDRFLDAHLQRAITHIAIDALVEESLGKGQRRSTQIIEDIRALYGLPCRLVGTVDGWSQEVIVIPVGERVAHQVVHGQFCLIRIDHGADKGRVALIPCKPGLIGSGECLHVYLIQTRWHSLQLLTEIEVTLPCFCTWIRLVTTTPCHGTPLHVKRGMPATCLGIRELGIDQQWRDAQFTRHRLSTREECQALLCQCLMTLSQHLVTLSHRHEGPIDRCLGISCLHQRYQRIFQSRGITASQPSVRHIAMFIGIVRFCRIDIESALHRLGRNDFPQIVTKFRPL